MRQKGYQNMTDVCLIFEVHQPLRLNKNFHYDLLDKPLVKKEDLFNLYFNHNLNRHVFERAARKCYFPTNNLILEQIDQFKRNQKQFKVAYGLSGVFVEQCERWNPRLLDSFKQLADTGCVEFLDETYYHSLASLYDAERSEFVEQLKMHCQLIKDLFDHEPKVVANTECVYNNAIAKTVEALGYEAMITEGVERILDWRSPNYVYKAKNSHLRVLLRNYRLSDDIGFRFSSRWWEEWPLTAEKYASWLAASPGQVINIFLDYETFGEHHWPESGIHEFLRWLPGEILKWDHLRFSTPSEAVRRHSPVGEIDVHEFSTISWADLERDTTAWICNSMQMTCYKLLKELEPLVKQTDDPELMRLWRYLQISDHLYYMSTKGGGPGDVHDYFNPHGNPIEAFATYFGVLSNFEAIVLRELEKPKHVAKRILRKLPANKGFKFFYKASKPTSLKAQSLKEFYSTLKKVNLKSVRFHTERGDFEKWIRWTIGDSKLADRLAMATKIKRADENLRKRILDLVEQRIKELETISGASSNERNLLTISQKT
jgi:alpha-amylase